ncbi:hypothetical protein [Halosegnis marinus]|uniref:Uncharacterized protein n=1 Tax=Halosegnis marinus TaxID=3034023 RepID=A0ABD5ZL29_9EURY|nr:hypothetical protein [Halosegnis sp. DT85]
MTDERAELSRRGLLAGGGVAALAGAGVIGATFLDGGGDDGPVAAEAGEYDERALAERFAPDLHFGRYEKWFPTDPRSYVRDRDGERVVDGFAALNGYSGDYLDAGDPPAPTVFYNVVEVTPALVAVQYWMYYAFDQFTVNFHWHDWELLQVFVDVGVERGGTPESASGGTASDPEPVLLSASSHSRKVPNNEFLDPGDGDTVAVLSEVGSHSSATTVNEEETTFQRTALADLTADVTNAAVSVADAVEALPLAYGLPRDEGGRLPFVMPELDGVPLYDHPDVSVPREAFVDESVTVRDLADLARPPGDLPTREHGTTFTFGESGTESEAAYALAEVADLTDIDRFVGPQLSFEFAIPGFVEDRFASHITTAGTPWDQPRFTDPVSDVTDGAHRAALADRYGLDIQRGLGARVFGAVEELAAGAEGTLRGADGSDDAVRSRATVSFAGATGEAVCLLESEDPAAVPTANGVVGFVGVEEREHRLTTNAAGYAPRSERFTVEGDTRAGVEGRLPVVRREEATRVRVSPDTDLARVRATDDFAGAVFDARPPVDGDFALYLHREGRYSLEVEDEDGNLGAYRVEPEGDEEVSIESAGTGPASLAAYLVDYLAESARLAREFEAEEDTGRESVAAKVDAALRDAERAAEAARADEDDRAREELRALRDRLARVRAFLREEDRFSEGVTDLLLDRVATADTTAERALAALDGGETATPMPTETATPMDDGDDSDD